MKEKTTPYELMKELERRSRVVRTARIEASKRCRDIDSFNRLVTFVYSTIVTVISIRFALGVDSLDDAANKQLSLLLLATSIFVTLFTMYVSSQNSGEKVGRFQSNYMELTRLLSEIELANIRYESSTGHDSSREQAVEDYLKFSKRYASLLTQSDNHEDIDYWNAVLKEERGSSESSFSKRRIAENQIRNAKIWMYIKRTFVFLSVPLLVIGLVALQKLFLLLF